MPAAAAVAAPARTRYASLLSVARWSAVVAGQSSELSLLVPLAGDRQLAFAAPSPHTHALPSIPCCGTGLMYASVRSGSLEKLVKKEEEGESAMRAR